MTNNRKLALISICSVLLILVAIFLLRIIYLVKPTSSATTASHTSCEEVAAALAEPSPDYTYPQDTTKDNDLQTAEDHVNGRIEEVCKSIDGSYQLILDASGTEWNVFSPADEFRGLSKGDCIDATVLRSDSGNSFTSPAERRAHLPRFVSMQRSSCNSAQPPQ